MSKEYEIRIQDRLLAKERIDVKEDDIVNFIENTLRNYVTIDNELYQLYWTKDSYILISNKAVAKPEYFIDDIKKGRVKIINKHGDIRYEKTVKKIKWDGRY